VEINGPAAAAAQRMNPQARILHGDILEISADALSGERFDVVFSLSCVDWNVRFADMLAVAWDHVRPGGYFVATFRLTTGEGCNDMSRSHQFINYEGRQEGELAPYVVLNVMELGEQLVEFGPSDVIGNGYWGRPSATAVTPYDSLCFVALAIRRPASGHVSAIRYKLDLPAEIRELLELQRR
jgi:SAM-dependent methyltransferase